jgi:S1-C subfamily serine protease
MRKFAFTLLTFAAGAAVAVLVVVLLTATGILPIKTLQTTVIGQSPATTGTTTQAALTTGSLTPEEIYQQDSPGVVEVLSTFAQVPSYSPFGLPSSSSAQALGSGFVVSSQGYILTNAHVVADSGQKASSVSVVFKGSGSSTTTVKAQIVGIDETSDVAVLQVDPAQTPKLDVLQLGDSSKVQPGEPVVAIGNPLGYDFSVTSGIVSATDRNLQSPNGSTIPNGIQTDAAINEGNSGGPLIDSSGHVIGINEQIASVSGGNQGLGFAVPINTAVRSLAQLKTGAAVKYAWLGIYGWDVTSQNAKQLGTIAQAGALVTKVAPNGPAQKAGIKGGTKSVIIQGQNVLAGGDVIVKVDGQDIASLSDLQAYVATKQPGDTVTVTVIRNGKTQDIKVTLETLPANL